MRAWTGALSAIELCIMQGVPWADVGAQRLQSCASTDLVDVCISIARTV